MAQNITFESYEAIAIVTEHGKIVHDNGIPKFMVFTCRDGSGYLSVYNGTGKPTVFRANSGSMEYMNNFDTSWKKACSKTDPECYVVDPDTNKTVYALSEYITKRNNKIWDKHASRKFWNDNPQLKGGTIPLGHYFVTTKIGGSPRGFNIEAKDNQITYNRQGLRIHGSKLGFEDMTSQGCIAITSDFSKFCDLMNKAHAHGVNKLRLDVEL